MDVKQLQLLVDLAEAGSLSRVCVLRGVAQSALSKQICSLENDLSAKLFHRTGRGVLLTDIGREVVPRARAILAECDQLRNDIRSMSGVPSGPVRLAIQTSVTQSLVGALFQRIRRDFDQIELRLMEGFSGTIEEWLVTGRADIGVLSRYGSHTCRTDELLGTDELYLVGPAGDPMTSEPTFKFADLAGLPLVLPGAPDGVRMLLAETARKHGVSLTVAVEVDSLAAMKAIVVGGYGYTILTRQAVQAEIDLKSVQTSLVTEPTLTRTLVLATTAQRPMSDASRVVNELVRELLSDTHQKEDSARAHAGMLRAALARSRMGPAGESEGSIPPQPLS